jgi:phosphocarrier protein HPr
MSERQVTIGSKVGLHARPASLFAKAVKDAGVPVKIAKDGKPPVNAASLLSLLTLGAEFGDEVTLSAEAETALDGLAEMLGRDLDAE